MATLTEYANWEQNDPIYLIQPHDPVMGGEYGINNIQPRQLACRTSWLRQLFTAEHGVDGSHSLKNVSLADNTSIEETKLDLHKYTQAYYDTARAQSTELSSMRTTIDNIQGAEGSVLAATCEALLLAWTYGDNRFAFDLFNDKFTFEDNFEEQQLYKSVAGDDSIDIVDSNKVTEGDHFIIHGTSEDNEEYSQTVRVETILSKTRILVSVADFLSSGEQVKYDNVTISSGDDCKFGRSSYKVTPNGGLFAPSQAYYTRTINVLENYPTGKLIICQNVEPVVFTVFSEDDAGFTKRTVTNKYLGDDGFYRVVYELPGGVFKLYIENTSTDTTALIDNMAIMQNQEDLALGLVRQPQVVKVGYGFKATRYGALYDVAYQQAQVDLAVKETRQRVTIPITTWPHANTSEEQSKEYPLWEFLMLSGWYTKDINNQTIDSYFTGFRPSSTNPLLWRIRYQSTEGEWSAWSDWGKCIGV